MRLFTLKSSSIRRLDFITKTKSRIRYFDSNECGVLINSPLVLHCEVLLIGIKHRTNILDLIHAISTLRSLTCHCKDDEYNSWNSSLTYDELVEWLRNRLPSTYSISRDEKQTYLIRLWIGQH
jgi:hypothetical protein